MTEDPEIHRLRMAALEAKLAFGSAADVWRRRVSFKYIGDPNVSLRCQAYPWHRHGDRSSEFARIRGIADSGIQREQHDALRLVCDLFDAWNVAQDAFEKADAQ